MSYGINIIFHFTKKEMKHKIITRIEVFEL